MKKKCIVSTMLLLAVVLCALVNDCWAEVGKVNTNVDTKKVASPPKDAVEWGQLNKKIDNLIGQNEYDESIELLSEYLKKTPSSGPALAKIAGCYIYKKDYVKAEESLKKAEKNGKALTVVDQAYAVFYLEKKDFNKALEYANKSLATAVLKTEKASSYGCIAHVYDTMNNSSAAKENLQKAISLDPGNAYFKQAIKKYN